MLENLKPETLAKFTELMRRRRDNRSEAERQRAFVANLPQPDMTLDAAAVAASIVRAAAIRDAGGYPLPALDPSSPEGQIIAAGIRRRGEA
jgi:hypothetical protein